MKLVWTRSKSVLEFHEKGLATGHAGTRKETHQNVVPERIALPCLPKVILAQHAVDLHIPSWMVDGMNGEAEEVHDEAEDVQVTVCRRSGVED